uniref:RanBP2-type domain-containing protein n=1 Tax=viral metagenome TaxID=1070528 RepID=A0A6C0KHM1_9ZZZZ
MSHTYISGPGGNYSSTDGVVIGADKLREMVPKIRIPNKNKTRSVLEERSAMMRNRDSQMARQLQETRASAALTPSEWACTSCTFHNANSKAKCDMCSTVRPSTGVTVSSGASSSAFQPSRNNGNP